MNVELVVWGALVTGVLLLVVTLGLQASPGDVTALLRQPGRLLRSLTSMLVVMPIVAATLAYAFDLEPAVKLALVSLSLSPVPPILPHQNIRAGGDSSYAIGLLVATGLVSVVHVPLALALLSRVFDIPLSSSWRVISPVVATVFVPLMVGLIFRRLAPRVAVRVAGPAGRLATLLLLAGLVPMMVIALPKAWPLVGNGTLLTMLLFSLTGLAAGHLLGGSTPADRLTLARSTAARHPGVAVAIAAANFPDQTLVFSAVLLYVGVNAIASQAYSRWAARRDAPLGRRPAFFTSV